MSTTQRAGAWCGWWRAPGCGWSLIARGSTRDTCVAALDDALVAVRGGTRAVLPAGVHPDARPATFGRRFL
jgi:hypothetical protein